MNYRLILGVLCSGLVVVAAAQSQEGLPSWAYVTHPPDYQAPADDGSLRHVPDSTAAWTLIQVRDYFFAPDWHPGDHLPMPEVVARGRKPEVFACGFCHRADGPGGPENAGLAGLPEAYIIQQMADFKSGVRQSAAPTRGPQVAMVKVAQGSTDAEIKSAAAYFSALKPRKIIDVVEADVIPKTHVAGWVLSPLNDTQKEPIGHRIIEMPKDLEQFESRDARSQFVAYVPPGSLAKGAALVKTGNNGATIACITCHGADLKGAGPVPGIAGRSPSYIVRQLFDFQRKQRAALAGQPMIAVVAKLNEDDFIAIAAYAASLEP